MAAGVPPETIQRLLQGWNEESEVCRMLSSLGVDRAFVDENRDKYFGSNVYDTVKPRLENQLLQARQQMNRAETEVLSQILEVFEQERDQLRQITEYNTLIGHMSRCDRHG